MVKTRVGQGGISKETQEERCGHWCQIGGTDFVCMRPIDHDDDCRPKRSEITGAIAALDAHANALSLACTTADNAYELWPYEGPKR